MFSTFMCGINNYFREDLCSDLIELKRWKNIGELWLPRHKKKTFKKLTDEINFSGIAVYRT